jgi:hypothetical protein
MPLTTHCFALTLAAASFSWTAVQASVCSEAETTDIGTFAAQYSDKIDVSCTADSCSSECLANVTMFAELLPNCECLDGTNYRQSLLTNVTACDPTSDESTSGSGVTTLTISVGTVSRPSTTNSGTTSGTTTSTTTSTNAGTVTSGTTAGGRTTNHTTSGNGSPAVGMASLPIMAASIGVVAIQLLL